MQTQFDIYKRKGYLTIIFGFIGFFIWASFYKIDQGVYCQGFIVSRNEKIEIISPLTGLIEQLNIAPGKIVEKDDAIIFFNENQIKSKLASLKNNLNLKQQNILILEKQLENQKALVEKAVIHENALLPFKSRIITAKSEFEEIKGNFEELNEKSKLLIIRSPINGSVMNLSIKSSKINVKEGQHLLDIIPSDQDLFASIQIPVNFANKVVNEMEVNITFPTLIGSNSEKMIGKLIYFSADKVKINDEFYFEGKVEIKKQDFEKIKEIKTGLPIAAIIKTGGSSMLSYILKPINDRLNRGIK
jgi:multidrug efflux pump subunit AcrA (membrane-fusion protein)